MGNPDETAKVIAIVAGIAAAEECLSAGWDKSALTAKNFPMAAHLKNTSRVHRSFASFRAAPFTCAEGSKSRISKIEIIGSTRINKANARKKKPSVPKKVM
jgi:hypothetical protein